MDAASKGLHAAAERALPFVADGNVVGLGSGRAAATFIQTLAERVREGLRIRGVPTSEASAELAKKLGIPLATLDEVEAIDVDFDGADEVDPACNLIKGKGGALVREKLVATASKRVVILVGAEKVVPVLGTQGILPVEIVRFGLSVCRRKLAALGYASQPRMQGERLFVTDNNNYILDCQVGLLAQPAEAELAIRAIPGVVGTGLFLGMADIVIIQRGENVEVRQNPSRGG